MLDEDLKSRVEIARRTIEKENAEKKLIDFLSSRPIAGVNGKIIRMWHNFEELLFIMSKADKGTHTIKDFWNMNVYDFLRYKQLLTEHVRPKEVDED